MAVSVLILGAGLVGSSLGLALTRAGYDVVLWDIVSSHSLVAAGLGRVASATRPPTTRTWWWWPPRRA